MNTKQKWMGWTLVVLLAAVAALVTPGAVAAEHCALAEPARLPVRTNSWARFEQYYLASAEEAAPEEITYGRAALATRVCLDGDSGVRFDRYLQAQEATRFEPDSWKRFELYLIGVGTE